MNLDDHWIQDTWQRLVCGTTVPEQRTVLFVVTGERDYELSEAAHLRPGAIEPANLETSSAVLREVGIERLNASALLEGVHRFGLFQSLDAAPLSAVEAVLRHELRHAEQYDELGLRFWEIDAALRVAMRAHGDRYRQIPTERDADRAAALLLRSQHHADLPAIREDPRFAHYADVPDSINLTEATIAALEGHEHEVSDDEIEAARESASDAQIREFRTSYGNRGD